jgi:hypothetical protein
MSLEMAHKVILPPKKNYIPQFLKQRDINSYNPPYFSLPSTGSWFLDGTYFEMFSTGPAGHIRIA